MIQQVLCVWVSVLIETQLRGVDMRSWRWDELDIGSKVLRITHDKTKEAVEVELTETAREVLKARYNERGDNVYVFQNDNNRTKGKPISRSKIHAEIEYAVDKLKMRGLASTGSSDQYALVT